ncbi:50S ribosomal protein L3 [Candidatus Marsarchaeota archaeon]|nr:50S ribosomal protein L3 [Candidatus Marsarchaeota archaeon]MCL5404859.1 50S ribosomal protein L3 [Candidatus Marsarchaeota archaeon]
MAGSLEFWPRRRAQRRLPRIRGVGHQDSVAPSNLVAYKAGMLSVSIMDDSESPTKGQEVIKACTVLELPHMEVYGIRIYKTDKNTGYRKASVDILSKQLLQHIGSKKAKIDESKLPEIAKQDGITAVSLLVVSSPKQTGASVNHKERFEAQITGGNIEERLKFASEKLGKEITAQEFFQNGEFVDAVSVSKGKGWQGPIKRFGIKRLNHKATGKIRHVGTLGAFTPGKTFYTVPMPGQMGFNYRTEHNKRILKLGKKESNEEINPPSGFKNYGLVRSDYIILEGSVPGPAKRIVRLKKSVENRNSRGIKEPKLSIIR